MCWYRSIIISEDNQPSYEAVDVCRAPSWSWASVQGRVVYHDGLYAGDTDHGQKVKQFAKVIGAECSLEGPSLTGQVSHGSVELRCFMVPASAENNSIDTIGRMPVVCNLNWHSDRRCVIEKQGEYYFIPLARIGKHFCGIIVKPTHRGSREFTRIGFANTYVSGWEVDDEGLFWEIFDGAKQTVRIVTLV